MSNIDITKKSFLGAWALREMSLREGDEAVHFPNGRQAKGLLVYTAGGQMSAQIGDPERKRHASADYRYPTDEELRENYPDFISYFGGYEVIPEHGLVIHDVEMSLFPNWIGTRVKRYFEFSEGGKALTLKATPIPHEGRLLVPTLVWERLESF
jgi:hypothetical protein